MPFGLIFGTLFFGVLCGALGLRWLFHPTLEGKAAGVLLLLLGYSLAGGLLTRRSWARWMGAAMALLLMVFGLRLVASQGDVLEHLLVLAALATAGLLIVPATGDPRRAEGQPVASGHGPVGPLGWTALASLVGLIAIGTAWDESIRPTRTDGALPASAIGQSVRWMDFEPGLERARAENKPVIATFITDWCPYCSKMTRNTWRASAVAERMNGLIAVKVDVEEDTPDDGVSGRALAERYGIAGYPVQLLLDPEGGVLARHAGYQGPRELLRWVDDALGTAPATGSAARIERGSGG